MPHAVQAFIFDLGKVVFDYSFDETLSAWASDAKLSVPELKSRFVWDGTYERYERGELGLGHFHRRVVEQLGCDIALDRFEGAWISMFRDEIPGTRSLLQRLKPHYPLVALSNTNQDHARTWRRLFPEPLSCFEAIFASHEIGVRKPDPQAFQIVLDYLKKSPEEVVFIDDSAENIEAAGRLGLQVVLFENAARLENSLLGMGVSFTGQESSPLSVPAAARQ